MIPLFLLAPTVPDLPWAEAEVGAIEHMPGLDVTPRFGNVTADDVLYDMGQGRYKGFWFAGHASAKGLILTNGVLSADELAPMLRGRIDWIFLNTCESQEIAKRLRRDTGAAVVATIRELPDKVAYQTGVIFAQWMAVTGDVALAHEKSRPSGQRVYIYEAGETKVVQQPDIQKILERLVRLIDGDPALRMVGLVDKMDAVIKADNDWKRATEQTLTMHANTLEDYGDTLTEHDARLDGLEGKRLLTISIPMAIAVVIGGATALVLAFWLLTALQTAGGG